MGKVPIVEADFELRSVLLRFRGQNPDLRIHYTYKRRLVELIGIELESEDKPFKIRMQSYEVRQHVQVLRKHNNVKPRTRMISAPFAAGLSD